MNDLIINAFIQNDPNEDLNFDFSFKRFLQNTNTTNNNSTTNQTTTPSNTTPKNVTLGPILTFCIIIF